MAKKNFMTMTTKALMQLLQLFLYLVPLLTAILTLNYLGYTYMDDQVDIDPYDWRRKWLILLAWITVLVMALNIVLGTVSMSVMIKQR